jgi:hypothetical protein
VVILLVPALEARRVAGPQQLLQAHDLGVAGGVEVMGPDVDVGEAQDPRGSSSELESGRLDEPTPAALAFRHKSTCSANRNITGR